MHVGWDRLCAGLLDLPGVYRRRSMEGGGQTTGGTTGNRDQREMGHTGKVENKYRKKERGPSYNWHHDAGDA